MITQPTMTISHEDWTMAAFASGMITDGGETETVARDAADLYGAWWILHLADRMPGWTWKDGTFTGPARDDALQAIRGLDVEASDYVVAHLDEIRADAAKAAA